MLQRRDGKGDPMGEPAWMSPRAQTCWEGEDAKPQGQWSMVLWAEQRQGTGQAAQRQGSQWAGGSKGHPGSSLQMEACHHDASWQQEGRICSSKNLGNGTLSKGEFPQETSVPDTWIWLGTTPANAWPQQPSGIIAWAKVLCSLHHSSSSEKTIWVSVC